MTTPLLLGTLPIEIITAPYDITVGMPVCDYPANAVTPDLVPLYIGNENYTGNAGWQPSLDYSVYYNGNLALPTLNGLNAAYQSVILGRFAKTRVYFNNSGNPLALNPAPIINGVQTVTNTHCQIIKSKRMIAPFQQYDGESSYLYPLCYQSYPIIYGSDSVYPIKVHTPNTLIVNNASEYPTTPTQTLTLVVPGGIVTLAQNFVGNYNQYLFFMDGSVKIVGSEYTIGNNRAMAAFYNGNNYVTYNGGLYLIQIIGDNANAVYIPGPGILPSFNSSLAFGKCNGSRIVNYYRPDMVTQYNLSCFSADPTADKYCEDVISATVDLDGYLYVSTGNAGPGGNYGLNAARNGLWLGVSKYPIMIPPPKVSKHYATGNGTVFGHLNQYRRT